MANSISPTVDPDVPRIDQGATWFRDYRWRLDDNTPVDLTNYEITVCFFYDSGALAFGPFVIGDGVTRSADPGVFEIRIPVSETDKIKTETDFTMRVDMKRINSDDPVTGYKINEVAPLIAGSLQGYPKHAGK